MDIVSSSSQPKETISRASVGRGRHGHWADVSPSLAPPEGLTCILSARGLADRMAWQSDPSSAASAWGWPRHSTQALCASGKSTGPPHMRQRDILLVILYSVGMLEGFAICVVHSSHIGQWRNHGPGEVEGLAPDIAYGAFPLHGTARYGSIRFTFGGFSTGYCTWYFFSTTSAEVPSEPYHYQNVTCKLCWSLIGRRESSLLRQYTCDMRPIDPLSTASEGADAAFVSTNAPFCINHKLSVSLSVEEVQTFLSLIAE